MLYDWNPDKDSEIPIYVQLANHIRGLITSGVIKSGAKLPSRRTLTAKLDVSRNSVIAALELLIEEGLIISFPKCGFFVTDNWDISIANWQAYIKRARHRPGNSEIRHWSDAGGLTEFALSPDFDCGPYLQESFISAMNKMSKLDMKCKFSKFGFLGLREAIVKHVRTFGIKADVDNILICPSNILVLYPLYESLMTSGSNFFYEQSNLIMAISNIHSIGMNMIPIPLDQHGLSVTELKKNISRYKHPVLHLDLTDQAPTGIVMSRKRKRDLMDIINEHRLPVVEIDHLRDAWHDKPFPYPLKSMDEQGNIIYMGSMIRSCPCDLQMTWLIADKYIVDHLADVLVQNGIKANFLMQIAQAELFDSGAYYELMEGVREFIKKRREKALGYLKTHLSDIALWKEKNCGFHFWLEFPNVNIRKVFENSYFHDFHPGYFFDLKDNSHILLCPASLRDADIEKSIIEISETVRASMVK
ncbi:MAG: PLP-dependent aminotransferase family protein [Deferribacterales bacterium]